MRRLLCASMMMLWGCQAVPAPDRGGSPLPEAGKRAVSDGGMVASAHPLASDAGVEMLRLGGNAIDAAVATAFAVGVVEPMMSGIGGSGGMLIWNQAGGRADYLDFYAVAPSSLESLVRESEEGSDDRVGAGLDATAVRSAEDGLRAASALVAVPGAVAGLLEAHERMGRLTREEILAPAIRLAEEGFDVLPLLARTIADDSTKITHTVGAQELFWPNFRPLRAGERLVQRELAATLRKIAAEGRAGFHEGSVAREIVSLLNRGGNPMTEADLASFAPIWRRPMCGTYRGRVVLSAPPPQSGFQVIQSLNLLELTDLSGMGHPTRSGEAFHVVASAIREAAVDRFAYLGDPDRTEVPAVGLTSKRYALARTGMDLPVEVWGNPGSPFAMEGDAPEPACRALQPWETSSAGAGASGAGAFALGGSAPGAFAPGTLTSAGSTARYPEASSAVASSDESSSSEGETTHISVVDADGNAVSLTWTQGAYFGSGMWAAGTFLNNAMGIFSNDGESPNALRPGGKPGSTTTPTVILEDGRVRLVVGSPGGGRIPPAVVQTIVNILDYGMDPLDAVRMPRINPVFSNRVHIEQGVGGDVLRSAAARGYILEAMPPLSLFFGGVQVIERRDGRWVGAADPRRDGEVRSH